MTSPPSWPLSRRFRGRVPRVAATRRGRHFVTLRRGGDSMVVGDLGAK